MWGSNHWLVLRVLRDFVNQQFDRRIVVPKRMARCDSQLILRYHPPPRWGTVHPDLWQPHGICFVYWSCETSCWQSRCHQYPETIYSSIFLVVQVAKGSPGTFRALQHKFPGKFLRFHRSRYRRGVNRFVGQNHLVRTWEFWRDMRLFWCPRRLSQEIERELRWFADLGYRPHIPD